MTTMSVVIAAFNGGKTLGRALRSIAMQETPVDEVVLVNDGSTDNTLAVAEGWLGQIPMRIISNGTNLGLAASLRRGVEAAQGAWILRLDADDEWLPSHVGLLRAASEVPGATVITARAVYVDESGRVLGKSRPLSDTGIRARLMWDNPLVHSATGFNRRKYVDVGGYPLDRRWEDYWLWVQLLREGRLVAVNSVTVVYVHHEGSASSIRYPVAIRSRWECQKEALRLFWQRHPLGALRCLTLGGRASITRLCQQLRGMIP